MQPQLRRRLRKFLDTPHFPQKKIQNKKCNNSHHSRVERPHDPYEQDDAKHRETGQGVDGPEIQIQKQYIFFLFLFGNSFFYLAGPYTARDTNARAEAQ